MRTHTHTVHTHLHLPQLKENTDLFFRTTHALSTVLPLQYIKYKLSFKYVHWEVNITHSYSIYVSAYCGRQSHYDTVCPPPKKNQALQIPIALLISLKLTIHTSLDLHTTHTSVSRFQNHSRCTVYVFSWTWHPFDQRHGSCAIFPSSLWFCNSTHTLRNNVGVNKRTSKDNLTWTRLCFKFKPAAILFAAPSLPRGLSFFSLKYFSQLTFEDVQRREFVLMCKLSPIHVYSALHWE